MFQINGKQQRFLDKLVRSHLSGMTGAATTYKFMHRAGRRKRFGSHNVFTN